MKGLEGYRFSPSHSLRDPRDRRRVQAGVEVPGKHSNHLLPTIAQAITSLPVDVENCLVLVEQEEAIGRVVDEASEALLASA